MPQKQLDYPFRIEKWRLAQLMKVSDTTLRNMLNKTFYDELKKLGYNKYQKYLYQKQLVYLFPMGLNFEFN